MDFLSQMSTLEYWNALVRAHMTELVLVLTASIVVVLDRYFRRWLSRATKSWNVVTRFGVFLGACAVGYTVLSLGIARALNLGIGFRGGLYAAPAVLLVLVLVAVEAQRQKQI